MCLTRTAETATEGTDDLGQFYGCPEFLLLCVCQLSNNGSVKKNVRTQTWKENLTECCFIPVSCFGQKQWINHPHMDGHKSKLSQITMAKTVSRIDRMTLEMHSVNRVDTRLHFHCCIVRQELIVEASFDSWCMEGIWGPGPSLDFVNKGHLSNYFWTRKHDFGGKMFHRLVWKMFNSKIRVWSDGINFATVTQFHPVNSKTERSKPRLYPWLLFSWFPSQFNASLHGSLLAFCWNQAGIPVVQISVHCECFSRLQLYNFANKVDLNYAGPLWGRQHEPSILTEAIVMETSCLFLGYSWLQGVFFSRGFEFMQMRWYSSKSTRNVIHFLQDRENPNEPLNPSRKRQTTTSFFFSGDSSVSRSGCYSWLQNNERCWHWSQLRFTLATTRVTQQHIATVFPWRHRW